MTEPMDTQDVGALLRQTYGEAAQSVKDTPDPGQAFERATALVKAADDTVGEAAALRALMAQRLLREEGLSLGQLAQRLGISKSRADQLVRAAANREAGERG